MIKLELSENDMSALSHVLQLGQERLIGLAHTLNSQITAQQPQPHTIPENKINGADGVSAVVA